MADDRGEIGSWSDLTTFVETHGDSEWLFRGVTDKEYELIPKIAREYLLKGESSPDEPRTYNSDEEEFYFEMFKRQARPHVVPSPPHDLEWLAVAQHHGLPTRLLDWTWSPLVAAYFATEAGGIVGGEGTDAAIYAIHGFRQIDAREEREMWKGEIPTPFEFPHVRVYDPPHISPRIPAQQGAFTVHNDPQNSLTADESKGQMLEKWIIPSKHCYRIKHRLDVCAINRASLFPDLDGLARHLEWRYKWTIGYTRPS